VIVALGQGGHFLVERRLWQTEHRQRPSTRSWCDPQRARQVGVRRQAARSGTWRTPPRYSWRQAASPRDPFGCAVPGHGSRPLPGSQEARPVLWAG
jgi:hypothetical protein